MNAEKIAYLRRLLSNERLAVDLRRCLLDLIDAIESPANLDFDTWNERHRNCSSKFHHVGHVYAHSGASLLTDEVIWCDHFKEGRVARDAPAKT